MNSSSDSSSPAALERGARPRLHLTHVEGLRALAALVVFVNHAYAQTWNPMERQFPNDWHSLFSYTLVAGHFAVSVFIVISGFCLALPAISAGDQLKGGIVDFIKRRARRILPPYYAALALCLGLIWTILGEPTGSLWDVPIVVDWEAVVSHALLLQDVFRTGRINYVFWSIAVEWHIYFCFPLLLVLMRRRGLLAMVLATLVVGYLVTFAATGTRLERANPHYLGLFALGIWAAYVSRSEAAGFARLRERKWWGGGAMVSLAIVASATAAIGFELSHAYKALLDLFMGTFAACLLIHTCAHRHSLLRRGLEWRPLVALGVFSYSFYLIHAPLLQLVWQYGLTPLALTPTATFWVLMTLGLGVVVAGAYGFFLLFEKPFLTRKVPQIQRSAVTPAITQ